MKATVAVWMLMMFSSLSLPGGAETLAPPEEGTDDVVVEVLDAEPSPCLSGTAEVCEPAPVLHYTFDRSAKSLRVKDRSGQGNDGKAARRLERVSGIGGKGWAARFDGTNDYIRVPRSPSLEPESLTVDAWVRIDGNKPDFKGGTIVFKRNTGVNWNEGYCLEIFPDRSIRMTISNPPSPNGQKRLDSGTTLAPDLWHHLAMTFRPGEAVVYVDGKENVRMLFSADGSGKSAGLDHNSAADLFIGARDHATYPLGTFGGFDLAELRIWPKALDAERIAALYGEHAGQPGVAKPLQNKSRIDVEALCPDAIAAESLVLHLAPCRSCKTSAKVRDRSGRNHHGSATRSLRRVRDGGWRAWRFDSAERDFIRIPRSPSLEPKAITVAAWVRVPDGIEAADAGAIIFKRNTSFHDNEGYDLEILPDRRVRMTIGHSGGQRDVISSNALAPDLWHHVAMTFLRGEMRLYVDGEPAGEGRFIQALDHNPSTDLLIGGRDHASHPMDRFAWFDLADLRIWSKALDAKQIASLYGEFADRPKVARPADNRIPDPPPRTNAPPLICGTPCLPATNAVRGIRNDALVLHYAFRTPKDGTELRDRSGHQAKGSASKPLEWLRGPANLSGALRFDGREDYIRVPRSPSLESDVVTVAAWVKLDSAPIMRAPGIIVFKRNTSFHYNEGFLLGILTNQTLIASCGDGNGGQQIVVSPTALVPNVWHHLAMTAGNGYIHLFMDGKPVATSPWPHTLSHNPEADLFIGAKDHARFSIEQYCPMDLADIRIWSAVLGNAEIAALYREKAAFAGGAHPGEPQLPKMPSMRDKLKCGETCPMGPATNAVRGIRNDALVLHYAFRTPKDDPELRDRSGHQANGIASKPLEWVRGPGNLAGALRFNGVEDYIRVPRSPSLEPDVITVAAWVKLDGSRPMTEPGGTVVFKRNPSFYNNEDYHLEIRSNRTVTAVCANPAGVQTTARSPNPIAPDIWHHLAMSIGEGRIRLYVDGESVASTPCTHALNHNPAADLFIGAKDHVHFPIDHPCPMALADVRIWSAVLGDAEIAALYREKALFSDVAKPGMNRPPEPPRVFPPWQPPASGNRALEDFAAELQALLEQGRRDKAASPEFLDALQRMLDRHADSLPSSGGCSPMERPMP